LIVTANRRKITRSRATQAASERKPIDPAAFYSIRDITNRSSPYYLASDSTVFRALRSGDLKPNYLGRAVRLKGSAILDWLNKKGGDR
jgi:hypothetical protein